MWKYILTWLVFELVEIPCPDNMPGCLVYHTKFVYSGVEAKMYDDRDSAFAYYRSNIPKDGYLINGLKDSIRIDSIKLDYKDQPFLYTRKDKTFYFFK